MAAGDATDELFNLTGLESQPFSHGQYADYAHELHGSSGRSQRTQCNDYRGRPRTTRYLRQRDANAVGSRNRHGFASNERSAPRLVANSVHCHRDVRPQSECHLGGQRTAGRRINSGHQKHWLVYRAYLPPGGSVTITAVSLADTTQSGSATVNLTYGNASLSVHAFTLRASNAAGAFVRAGSFVADGQGHTLCGLLGRDGEHNFVGSYTMNGVGLGIDIQRRSVAFAI